MIELNKIYNEDCVSENTEEGMNSVEDKSIDMILCDLPYGTTQNKWDSVIPFESLWAQYKRIIKDNGAIVLFAQTPFDKVLGSSNIRMLKYEWIWEKDHGTGHLNAKKMPMKLHENILVFYKKLPTYNPQFWISKPMNTVYKNGGGGGNYNECTKIDNTKFNYTERYPVDIIKFNTVNGQSKEKTAHPTQKPVELFEYLIKTYTNEGDVVLDNCIGSGTTAIACINTKRNYIGFEMDKNYYDLANERISKTIDK